MLSRVFARSFSAAAGSAAASGRAAELLLNFATPSQPLVTRREVRLVTVPGRDGVFGVEKNSPPIVSELGPGAIKVEYKDGTSAEYFIPGGFLFKHENNVLDISTTESVTLDQIDADALRASYAEAVKARDAAAAGSKEQAEAKIALEVYKTLGAAVKVQL